MHISSCELLVRPAEPSLHAPSVQPAAISLRRHQERPLPCAGHLTCVAGDQGSSRQRAPTGISPPFTNYITQPRLPWGALQIQVCRTRQPQGLCSIDASRNALLSVGAFRCFCRQIHYNYYAWQKIGVFEATTTIGVMKYVSKCRVIYTDDQDRCGVQPTSSPFGI